MLRETIVVNCSYEVKNVASVKVLPVAIPKAAMAPLPRVIRTPFANAVPRFPIPDSRFPY